MWGEGYLKTLPHGISLPLYSPEQGRFRQRLALPEAIDFFEKEVIIQQIIKKINSPLTSSCGRLFDGVSALIGLRGKIDYEAQAAVELEMAASAVAFEEPLSTSDYRLGC